MDLLISGVDVGGKNKFLKLLRTDPELLLHKSKWSCFGISCFVFLQTGCVKLLALQIFVKDLFDPATAGSKSFIFNFASYPRFRVG